MRVSTAVLVAFLAGNAAALKITSPVMDVLAKRQGPSLPDIPEACQSTCGPLQTTLSSCQAVDCLCTTDVAESLVGCAQCGIRESNGLVDASMMQTYIDQYRQGCQAAGVTIPPLTLDGATPSGGAAAGSGTGGAAASQTGAVGGGAGGAGGNNPPASTPRPSSAASPSDAPASTNAALSMNLVGAFVSALVAGTGVAFTLF